MPLGGQDISVQEILYTVRNGNAAVAETIKKIDIFRFPGNAMPG